MTVTIVCIEGQEVKFVELAQIQCMSDVPLDTSPLARPPWHVPPDSSVAVEWVNCSTMWVFIVKMMLEGACAQRSHQLWSHQLYFDALLNYVCIQALGMVTAS